MHYAAVQQTLEKFVKTNWTHTSALQFEDVPFNTDLYEEFARCTIKFGDAVSRTVTQGCYRQFGVLMISVFVKPGKGTKRKLSLASLAADMITHKEIHAVLPHSSPVVKTKVADLYDDNVEKAGWVQAKVSAPFYYDF